MDQKKIARALGWFSIALGVTELVAPKQLCRLLGIDDHAKLIRTFGVREIGAGLGLLIAQERLAPWLWARVAGDALDLGALALGFRETPRKAALGSAIASVAAVTAVDFITAKAA